MTISEMKQRKQELGYSNEQVAALSGVPLGTVMKIFSGATKSPRRATLLALEKLFSPYRSSSPFTPGILRDPHGPSTIAEPSYVYGSEAQSFFSGSGERLFTVDDYYALPDDIRTELIDGVFYDMSSPSVTHQIIIGELFLQFKACEKKHAGRCRVILSPCDVQLDRDQYTMVQPDLLVVCDMEMIKGRNCFGAPDLVVEILSPSSVRHDCVRKLRKYKNAGVREYWIADPKCRQIMVYLFHKDGRESTLQIYSFSDKVPIGISEGACTVDFQEVADSLLIG